MCCDIAVALVVEVADAARGDDVVLLQRWVLRAVEGADVSWFGVLLGTCENRRERGPT
jgi:hypothetical protein